MLYASLTLFKEVHKITAIADDQRILSALRGASRMADRACGLDKGAFLGVTETVVVDIPEPSRAGEPVRDVPLPKPLLSLTTVLLDRDWDGDYEETIAASAFQLRPPGGAYALRLRLAPWATITLPPGGGRLMVTGAWGVSTTVPEDVERAVLLLANRLLKRPASPEGVLGSSETAISYIRSVDPDAATILSSHRLRVL